MCFPRKELHSRHQKRHHGFSDRALPSPELLPSLGLDPALSIQQTSSSGTTSASIRNASGAADSRLNHATSVWLDSAVATNSPQRNGPSGGESQWQSLPSDHTSAPSSPSQRRLGVAPDQAISHGVSRQTWEPAPSIQTLLDAALVQASVSEVCNPSPNIPSANDRSVFQSTLQFSHNQFGSVYEDDLWLSSLDASYPPGCATPYPFFTTGFESLRTPGSQIFPFGSSGDHAVELQISDGARERLQAALQGMYGIFRGPTNSHGQLSIPEKTTLDRYWKMFWAIPGRNMPFIHEASTAADHAPVAMTLAMLADGAMYCGDKHVAMAFFECSRRLVSQYMDDVGSQATTIPLWVINTLLMNCVFGLPGGDALHTHITVSSLESLLSLASRLAPLPFSSIQSQGSTVDEQWRSFIEIESHKR